MGGRKLPTDVLEVTAGTPADTPHFDVRSWKTDRRTRFHRMAESMLEAFLFEIGPGAELSPADKIDIETAALDAARARVMQERFAKGEAVPCDVTAAAHLARKGRSAVSRIAKRVRSLRRAGR